MKRGILAFALALALGAGAVLATGCSKETLMSELSEGPFVDLGLSVKWATCNLGANDVTESGLYYQWAGLADVHSYYDSFSHNSTPYFAGYDDNNNPHWTKYVSEKAAQSQLAYVADGKLVLEKDDDIAYVTLGNGCRIPTKEECEELKEKCDRIATTVNGVRGALFTSKVPGYKGRCIFIPFCGMIRNQYDSSCYDEEGYVWTSSLDPDNCFRAYYMKVNGWSSPTNNASLKKWCAINVDSDYREYALAIRPVCGK